jgi:hypothetical protein
MVCTVTLVIEVMMKRADYGAHCDFGIRGVDKIA